MSTLVDTKQIADMLGVTRAHVTDVLTKQVDFPGPKVNHSQRLRRWDAAEIESYFARSRTRQAPAHPAPIPHST